MTTVDKQTPHPIFIAMCGKKQVGKDTSTAMAVEILNTHGKKVFITAFANTLKDMCVNTLGIKKEGAYGTDADKNALSPLFWDTLPLDIRLKYSNEWLDFGTPSDDEMERLGYREEDLRHRDDGITVPRSGPMTNREVLQVVGTDIFRTMLDNNVWVNATLHRDWTGFDVVIVTDCRFPNEKQAIEDAGGYVIRLERNTGFTDNHASETALDNTIFQIKYENNGSLDELYFFMQTTLRDLGLLNGK